MSELRALTVAPIASDPALRIALARIRGVALVTGALGEGSLAAFLSTVAPAGPTALDLVGHTARGLVQLGAWAVGDLSDPEIHAWVVESGPDLVARGISRVRVLGCGSAVTLEGIRALQRYRWGLNTTLGSDRIRVYGTSQPLRACHFDGDGFRPGGPLVEIDEPPGDAPATAADPDDASSAHRIPTV